MIVHISEGDPLTDWATEVEMRDAEIERLRSIIKAAWGDMRGLSSYLSVHGFTKPIPSIVALRKEAEG